MLVAELSNSRQFRITEAPPVPDPAAGQVQVAVKAVGVCGSDLHYFSDGGIGEARCVYPMVLGHEPAGVVRKIGPGVSGFAVGDRAVLEPAVYCYHCEFCMTGHHNVCANLRFLSQPGEPGFFREFVNLPAHNLLPLPDHLSDREGALAEPLAVVLHSMQFATPRPGETAVVFGAGPIGLLTIAVLKLSGVTRIWSVEPVAHRRDLSLTLGAAVAFDPTGVDPAREILRDTANRGVDIAIDCAGKADSINQCIQAARHAGRVVVTGIPSEDYVRLALHILRRKELAFYSVRRSNHDSASALRLLADHAKFFAPIFTHERPLADIQQAFELCEQYADGVGKLTMTL
jgi:L-iditol 2-dehydrogenase